MADAADPLPKVQLAGGYSARYPHRGHYFFYAGLGLAAFVITCLGLHSLMPRRNVPEVSSKIRYFEQHNEQFDTIFIGSSRIERHIVPAVFDELAAKRGIETHSFNLGVGGMHPPESFYALTELLRAKPRGLKWVFMELEELYPTWTKEDTGTLRSLHWHDWPMTRLVLQKTLDPEGKRPWYGIALTAARSKTAGAHIGLFLKNLANVGRAGDLIGAVVSGPSSTTDTNSAWERDRGYNSHGGANDNGERFDARMRKWSARRPTIDWVTERGYRDCVARIRAAGAVAVFVVPPNPSEAEYHFPEPTPAVTLAFNDRNRYAELYESDVRTDPQHLTSKGARIFTELVSERFVEEVARAK